MKNSDKYHFMVVGDVHEHYAEYLETINLANYSLQLGDLGFNYAFLVNSGKWSVAKHKFLPGNHDNYTLREVYNISPKSAEALNPYGKYVVINDKVYLYTHLPDNFIGNFGIWQVPETKPSGNHDNFIFFVRGAWSIDFAHRTPGLDIWENEELTPDEFERALQMYQETKPSIVVTHTSPLSIENYLEFNTGKGTALKTRTSVNLQRMLDIHRPKIWLFGHHHQPFDQVIEGCRFVCLEELSFLCFDQKLDPL